MSCILGIWLLPLVPPPPVNLLLSLHSPVQSPCTVMARSSNLVISVLLPCVLRGGVTGDCGVLRTHLHAGVLHCIGAPQTQRLNVSLDVCGGRRWDIRGTKVTTRGLEGSQVDSVHLTPCRAAGGRRKPPWRREDAPGPQGGEERASAGGSLVFPSEASQMPFFSMDMQKCTGSWPRLVTLGNFFSHFQSHSKCMKRYQFCLAKGEVSM